MSIKEDSFEYWILLALAVCVAVAGTIIKNCAIMLRGEESKVEVDHVEDEPIDETEVKQDVPLGIEDLTSVTSGVEHFSVECLPYPKYTIRQLKSIARIHHVPQYWNMNKAQLQSALDIKE